jgi:hypothetical protein
VWHYRRSRRARDSDAEHIGHARAEAAASLARAEADHAREAAAAGHDTHLAESLREIREQNHFADVVAEAFRGRP